MNVLVVGSGGREHALCYAFRRSADVDKVFCANGNAGIASIAQCVPIDPDDITALLDFALQNQVALTFVGGETPLALGIVDRFTQLGLRIIGPGKEASMLESSKSFAKDFMGRHGVPTASYATAHTQDFAIEMLESGDFGDASKPIVVKADGLAAGKGVVMAKNRAEAVAAIKAMSGVAGTKASEKIVLENCLFGKEVSLLMFADGEKFALMPPTRDHKRIGDGDTGLNTGGMGAVTDSSLLTQQQLDDITEYMIRPTLHGCVREGFPFRGILFLGLMLTAEGPKLLEYNVRFGDPETQAILVRLETPLFDICEAMLDGTLNDIEIKWRSGSSACVVLASEGYPGKPRVGDTILGVDQAALTADVQIFHSGTARDANGSLITHGGRVLGATAVGDDLSSAVNKAYAAADKITWPGMQLRHDIGR